MTAEMCLAPPPSETMAQLLRRLGEGAEESQSALTFHDDQDTDGVSPGPGSFLGQTGPWKSGLPEAKHSEKTHWTKRPLSSSSAVIGWLTAFRWSAATSGL